MLFLPWYFNRSFINLAVLPSTAKSAMYPSRFKMPAMLSFILEWGISTAGSNARLALRIRVNISEMGSFTASKSLIESETYIFVGDTASELPTRFGDTRDQAVEGRFAESQTGAAELAQIPMAAATHGTAIDHAHRAGVARQFG